MTDPHKLAASLTLGQRRAILAIGEDGGLPTYSGFKRNGDRRRVSLPTIRRLQDMGLLSPYPYALNASGLAVRAVLIEEGGNGH